MCLGRVAGPGSRPGSALLPGAPPVVDVLLSEGGVPWAGHTAQHAMPEVYEAIKRARIALVFVNTRFQAEFAFQGLWRLNDDNLPIALHNVSGLMLNMASQQLAAAVFDCPRIECAAGADRIRWW